MVLFALLLAFTAGSIGSEGRPFLADLGQAAASSIGWILVGGIIFNLSNILLSASISLAGMSVAFPLGVGLALVMGVGNNYLVAVQQGAKTGEPLLLILGVALVFCAIVFNVIASSKKGGDE
jgi:glucose uptake protein